MMSSATDHDIMTIIKIESGSILQVNIQFTGLIHLVLDKLGKMLLI